MYLGMNCIIIHYYCSIVDLYFVCLMENIIKLAFITIRNCPCSLYLDVDQWLISKTSILIKI